MFSALSHLLVTFWMKNFFFVSCVEAHKYFTARGQQDIVMAKIYNLIRIEKNEGTGERMKSFWGIF